MPTTGREPILDIEFVEAVVLTNEGRSAADGVPADIAIPAAF
jgi:hypothetical protein